MPDDFRRSDWGEPKNKQHLLGAATPEQKEDFRTTEWGTPREASVTTPGAETPLPDEGENKPVWEEYARSQGLDTNGMNKEQIIKMVKEQK